MWVYLWNKFIKVEMLSQRNRAFRFLYLLPNVLWNTYINLFSHEQQFTRISVCIYLSHLRVFSSFLIFTNSMGVKCSSVQLFCIFSLPVSMRFFSFFLCGPHLYVLCHLSLNFLSLSFLYLRPLWMLCKMSPFVINVAVIFFQVVFWLFLWHFFHIEYFI